MDGLTQGLLGAAASQAALGHKLGGKAAVVGFAAGAAPDLDILIRSGHDPLMALEFHRHFTHSLFFIPIGGLLVGALFWLFWRKSLAFWHAVLAATLAWATHGILDVLTSYGTNWLWPFSSARLAWDWIGIIDLFVTVPLLIGMVLAIKRKSVWPARIGLAFALVYIGFGAVQHGRAQTVQERIAAARGHTIERGRVMPVPLSLSVWRSVYEHDGRMYADAVRVAPLEPAGLWPGGSVARFDAAGYGQRVGTDTVLATDVARFEHFSDGHLFVHEDGPRPTLGDFRYALVPNSDEPLWGIRLDPERPQAHVQRVRYQRDMSSGDGQLFLRMLIGDAPGRVPATDFDAAVAGPDPAGPPGRAHASGPQVADTTP